MLTFALQPGPADQWRWDGPRLTDGRSWITPYRHPLVATEAITDGHRLLVAVRERMAGQPAAAPGPVMLTEAAYDQAAAGAAGWPAAFHVVEINTQQVSVTAGTLDVAPIVLTESGATLRGAWDLLDLRDAIDGTRLDDVEAARLLTYSYRYSTSTVFADAHRLTERATAVFDGRTLRWQFPASALHTRARALGAGVDPDRVLDVYEQLLADHLRARPVDRDRIGVEVSGGMDSAQTALTVAHQYPGQASTGVLLYPGPAGGQQRLRVGQLVAAGFASHVEVPMLDVGLEPLNPGWLAAHADQLGPDDEIYQAGLSALFAAWAAAGVDTVITGAGGDEMLSMQPGEAPPAGPVGAGKPSQAWIGPAAHEALAEVDAGLAPASVVNEMTLLGFRCGAPLLLRAGLWPVHPLASPELIAFGEQLPAEYRYRKELCRARLRRAGFGPLVYNPPLHENFADVLAHAMPRGVTEQLSRMLADGSVLFDRGLVDPDGIQQAVSAVVVGAHPVGERGGQLYEVAALDLAVRAFS